MRKHINLALLAVAGTLSLALGSDITAENAFLSAPSDSTVKHDRPLLKDYPKQYDWRQRSFVVPPVKTQPEGYKSSQAYALTSALEGQYGIKYNKGIQLSVQNVLDCVD